MCDYFSQPEGEEAEAAAPDLDSLLRLRYIVYIVPMTLRYIGYWARGLDIEPAQWLSGE